MTLQPRITADVWLASRAEECCSSFSSTEVGLEASCKMSSTPNSRLPLQAAGKRTAARMESKKKSMIWHRHRDLKTQPCTGMDVALPGWVNRDTREKGKTLC